MNTSKQVIPSEHSQEVLKALTEAVTKALGKKRKLGEYAIVWDGEKPVVKTASEK